MENRNFQQFFQQMGTYLQSENAFIANPERLKIVYDAYEIAKKMFPEADIQLADDPLQAGAAILKIACDDLAVCGASNISLFSRLIANADNFEIYPCNDGSIRFAAVFYKTYIRIG